MCLVIHFTSALAAATGHEATIGPDPEHNCLLWHYYDNNTHQCQCGDDLKETIQCHEDKTVSIKACYCITVNDNMEPLVGFCLYTCSQSLFKRNKRNINYIEIENNITVNQLVEKTCGVYNRHGLMCGQCIEGYGLPVYSYNLSCVECTDYKYNWLKYIAVAYGPLTVFYFIIIIFRISASSGLMIGYVMGCQMMATYSLVKFYLAIQGSNIYFKLFMLVYSIWNLDFFRSLYPPFCLHPHLSALQVLSIDYIVAVYPMILVLLTYLFVKLHDRFRLVVWLCRPAYTCFRHFRKEWNIKSSLIGAFATSLILSYVKILNVTANILIPAYLYNMHGNYGQPLVFEDSKIIYLSKEHLPYFITAVSMSLIFNIIPVLLLCLYPCRCFRKCLHVTRLHNQTLHTFMDAFQGCYRYKPCDCRFFSAVYLIMQILNLFLFIYLGRYHYHSAASYMVISIIIMLIISRPYKEKWHNVVNITLFIIALLLYIIILFQNNCTNLEYNSALGYALTKP